MKLVQILLAGALPALLGSSQPLRAEGFSLQDLNPFADREGQQDHAQRHVLVDASHQRRGNPSMLARVGDDLRRLHNGTWRFVGNTVDALCWKNWGKSSSPPPPPSRTSTHTWRTPSTPQRSNSSWFTPFWSREEPPRPKTPQDFVGMERPRM